MFTSGNRVYKLTIPQGEPRLLLFSPDSRTLYFTTTLNNSVQAYSIPNDELLPSLPSHPSPPNVIAVSSNGTILLSTSPSPPTIYLQDQRWGRNAAVSFRPTDACSPATCAAFQHLDGPAQPSYTNFVIRFQDGLLAMYRLFLPSLRKRSEEQRTHQSQFFQLQPVRVGVIKKLHKPAMGGMLAAEFIPGYKSRIVSIRHDGKCRLVDFESGGKVLRT
jgi:WD40 repeat protein